MFRRSLPALVLLAAPALAAAQVEVVSKSPDSVSVTIYRDLFALITETRTVDLPAEAHTLAFDNVVETLIPASAVVSELGRDMLERNYDYESLAPANLLRRSIGREVVLTRVMPGSGKVVQTRATITAANDDGVMLRTSDGHEALNCSGLPERLTFEQIPGDLNPTPRLSVRLAAGAAGKRTLKLSYIAQGFAWRSDYVAHLDSSGKNIDLTGWVTLRNLTRATLRQANVQVVAGRLNLLYDEDGGSSTIGATEDFEDETDLQEAREGRLAEMLEEQALDSDLSFLHGCYPFSRPGAQDKNYSPYQRARRYGAIMAEGIGDLEEVVVTGLRASLLPPEALADYHLYRIPWPTDLNARQTKQAVFLQKPHVKVERFYGFRFDEDTDYEGDGNDPSPLQPSVKLGFRNDKSSGLGEPLPSGMVRVFERDGDSDIFAGESQLGDKPVGVPIELDIARALDLSLIISVDDDPEDFDDSDAEAADITFQIANAKPRPVMIEIRQALPEEFGHAKVVKASQRTLKKHGDYTWRMRLAPNAIGSLTYRLVLREVDEEEDEDEDEVD